MFIVTNTSRDGTYTPSVFVRKEDAENFKRNLALRNAWLSMHGENYAENLFSSSIDTLNELFRRIGDNLSYSAFSDEERELIDGFIEFLESKGCSFYQRADYILYGDDSYNSIQLFEVPAPCDIQTSAGKATAVAYDDGCAKGVHLMLNDTIVCALDVYEAENGGEARILAYKLEYGEDEEEAPVACITINR